MNFDANINAPSGPFAPPTLRSAIAGTQGAWLAFIILLVIFGAIYYPFFPLPDARVGHDYSFMFPAWLDGFIWFRNNGLSTPWFSPSFCAGQPFFPDPQSTFYSIPQLFDLVAGPVNAAYFTLLMSATLIFWGGYLLMRKVFAGSVVVACLVGGLLMFNGFLPHRILVGHVTYHGFALVPWIALLLLMPVRKRFNGMIAALVAGLLLAYWVHSGLGSLILAAGLAVVAIALVYGLTNKPLDTFLARGALGVAIGSGVALAKLWASFSFLSNFPRSDYPLLGATSVVDAIAVAAGGLFLPSQWAHAVAPLNLTDVEWGLAPHEWAYNFGFIVVPVALALIAHRIFTSGGKFSAAPRQVWLWSLLLLCLAWPLAFNFSSPAWSAFLKTLPVIKSSTGPIRWLIVYIPLIAVGIGLLLEQAGWGRAGKLIAGVCLLGTVAQAALEPRDYYRGQEYDSRPIAIADKMLRTGGFVPGIRYLGTYADVQMGTLRKRVGLNDTFIAGISQVYCYNPVFGYRLEKFSPTNLVAGTIRAGQDGFLNLKNPACYVYPKENNCRPGDRFRNDQIKDAQDFVNYRPFSFNMSDGQKVANLVSLLTLCLAALGLVAWAKTFRS